MKVLLIPESKEELAYVNPLKKALHPYNLLSSNKAPPSFFNLKDSCDKAGITKIITTSKEFLELVLRKKYGVGEEIKASISNYAGSFFEIDGLEILVLPPLKQLYSVPYGKFVADKFLSKLTKPESWRVPSKFDFSIISNQAQLEEFLALARTAIFMACDIETKRDPLSIDIFGACIVLPDLTTKTVSIEIKAPSDLRWVNRITWDIKCPKAFQNGKYDISYLMRFGVDVYDYCLDTINLFHSWLAELPKDLAYISAFTVRNTIYWKDLSKSQDRFTQLLYNGRDCWNTAEAVIALMFEMPDWAMHNYTSLEFIAVHPNILCEAQGIKVDMAKFNEVKSGLESDLAKVDSSLEIMLGKGFNANSPKQCVKVLQLLGFNETSSADGIIEKCSFQSPFAARILSKISESRKISKLLGTYVTEDKLFNGRVLYAINAHGTETGRQASKEHHFWTGVNIQNQPRDKRVKSYYVADEGYFIAENDLEQAESRGTGYASGSEDVIKAVTGTRDFHSVNCSAFFGVPYEEIYSDEHKKVLKKALRDLAKRVNHGCNYCMGAMVLLLTMGYEKVTEARKLLGLPANMVLIDVCKYLIGRFHKTYPDLEGRYYPAVIKEALDGHLKSRATFLLDGREIKGWTRKCFDNPVTSKTAANSYIAHVSQNLNAMNLNLAFSWIFWNIWYPNRESRIFKLCAQIHDSVLYQVKFGHEYICEQVQKAMQIPIRIVGYDGNTRTFSVPSAIKAGKTIGTSLRWSETE